MTLVHEREETPLEIFLRVPSRTPVRGAIVGYVDGEIVVAVGRSTATCLPIGQALYVRAGGDAPDELPEGLARVVRRHEEESSRSFVLHPLEGDETSQSLRAWIAHVFNRRQAFRVRVHSGEEIVVTLTAPELDERFQGRLLDLSETGMGVGVGARVERLLAVLPRVHASFELPGSDDPIGVDALIRARILLDEGVRYGLEFEFPGGRTRGRDEAEIFRFVREREVELLRGKRDTE